MRFQKSNFPDTKPLPTIMKKIDKKEILISTAKSIFGEIPFVGTALNELFFEYNGTIKQKRLNTFIEILTEYFSENSEVNIENIKTENFNDIFESVLKRVVTTKSKLKLIRFRDILINELKNPTSETELIEIYLDLITSLSEEELIILYSHKYFDINYEKELEGLNHSKTQFNAVIDRRKKETIIIERSRYEEEYLRLKSRIAELEKKLNPLEKYRTPDFYKLTEEKFFFYKQRLFSKGLLYDNGMNRIGITPFQMMNITEFGLEFIKFIKESDK